jgi:hypothetical protein
MLGIGTRVNKNPKFVSWVFGGARLGKSQVRKLGRWWHPLEDESCSLQTKFLFVGVFFSYNIYIYIYIFSILSFLIILCHRI